MQGDWNQAEFEKLLAEWIVACDQPFDEVEKPEFRRLMDYTHHGAALKIPGRNSIRTRIMKMGEDTLEGMKKMFAVSPSFMGVVESFFMCHQELDSKVSISLDAWTSSNQHAFLAIVAHYITNDGKLGKYFLDSLRMLALTLHPRGNINRLSGTSR